LKAWTVIAYPLYAFLVFWVLWVFYLAVMNLKRARDAGTLSKTAWVFGMPVLLVGYALDIAVNLTLMSLILWEPPKEFTMTARLKRHHKQSTGWRLAVVLWFEPLLDPYDPGGDHI
jgi:hypothetical protein